MSKDWAALLASGQIEKLKNDELKAYLKARAALSCCVNLVSRAR